MATTNVSPTQSTSIVAQLIGLNTLAKVRNEDEATGNVDTTPQDSHSGMVVSYKFFFFANPSFPVYNAKHLLMDFDLSGISGTITGITLKLYGKSLTNEAGDSTENNSNCIIIKGTYDSSIGVDAINDFTGYNASGWSGSDTTEYSSDFGNADAGWSTSAYNEITLNSDAISDANSNSELKLYFMEKTRLFDNSDSYGNSSSSNVAYWATNFYADKDGSNPPILVVTHETAEGPTTSTFSLKGGNLSLKGGTLTIK